MEKLEFQNKVLRYTVLGLIIMLLILGIVTSVYITDTSSLRRDMLEYAQESIKLQYEQLKNEKDQKLSEGFDEIDQLEKLIDDYKNESLEIDDLLKGMEDEIDGIRARS